MRGSLLALALCAATASAALCAACLLTTNTDGIVGARPVDASGDDAGGDDASDDGGGMFCATQPPMLLCEDFDTKPLPGAFDNPQTCIGCIVTLDSMVASSAPNSLKVETPEIFDTSKVSSVLIKRYTRGAIKSFTWGFDFNPGACRNTGANGSATLAAVFWPGIVAVGMTLNPMGQFVFGEMSEVEAGLPFNSNALTPQPRQGQWQRIVMDVTFGASPHAQVTIDGNVALSVPTMASAPTGPLILNLGANANGPISACKFNYDNVTFDLTEVGDQ